MSKGFLALLAFAMALLATVPTTTASQHPGLPATIGPNDLQTKVLQDSEGNVHVLWLVPALNNSASGPGIWYSKYSPNGTDTIPPTKITNSTTIQSADLAVDLQGNAIIVWADDTTTVPVASSTLFTLRFNSTSSQSAPVLTTQGSLILWPSLALDDNGTIHLTWTQYTPSTGDALVQYGTITSNSISQQRPIASYDAVNAFPPIARVVFDNSSGHFQMAWGESQSDGNIVSTINYAKLVPNGTVLAKLQVAKFEDRLRDLSITPMTGQDGAFVVWQTQELNESLFVSQISASGRLVYLKQLNYTTGQSKYLAVSTDLQNNLYVAWYQPTVLNSQTPTTPTPVTNVTYVRMNLDGDIVQSGNGLVRSPVITVAVLTNGNVYAVSPTGLVQVVTPASHDNNFAVIAVLASMSCLGLAGSTWIEEGRYKWLSLCSKIRLASLKRASPQRQEILHLLARKPGLKLREINRLTNLGHVGMLSLIRMEKAGALASLRDGFSRRFYVRSTDGSSDALRTRVMLWILDHPGIWEAQLAKDLGLSQQIVHYHLKKLRDSKLITTEIDPDRNRKFYRFAHNVPEKQDSLPQN